MSLCPLMVAFPQKVSLMPALVFSLSLVSVLEDSLMSEWSCCLNLPFSDFIQIEGMKVPRQCSFKLPGGLYNLGHCRRGLKGSVSSLKRGLIKTKSDNNEKCFLVFYPKSCGINVQMHRLDTVLNETISKLTCKVPLLYKLKSVLC